MQQHKGACPQTNNVKMKKGKTKTTLHQNKLGPSINFTHTLVMTMLPKLSGSLDHSMLLSR